MTVSRFAPSPNGPLHLGHAYAAILAHDRARADGGRFLLRIEDIDGARSRAELVPAIRADLQWLGLEWEGVPAQSTRLDAYRRAAEALRALGLLYPCVCTRVEVAAAATAFGPFGPLYPGTCRRLDRAVHDRATAFGEVAWRLDMAEAAARAGPLEWVDEIAGRQRTTAALLGAWFGDVVLLRKEAPASYHLAATLDDATDGVTVVTRGTDLFAASHVHRLLQALLGLPVPVWHHHPLLLEAAGGGGDGRKLAKRRGSPALAERRRAGEDGRALARDLRAGRFPAGISRSSSLNLRP